MVCRENSETNDGTEGPGPTEEANKQMVSKLSFCKEFHLSLRLCFLKLFYWVLETKRKMFLISSIRLFIQEFAEKTARQMTGPKVPGRPEGGLCTNK